MADEQNAVTAASPDAVEVDPRDTAAPPLESEVQFVSRNGLVIPAVVVEVLDQEKGIVQLTPKMPLHRGAIPDEPNGYGPDLIGRGVKTWHHAKGKAPTEVAAAELAAAEAAAAEGEGLGEGETVQDGPAAEPLEPSPPLPSTRLAETFETPTPEDQGNGEGTGEQPDPFREE